MEPQADRRVVRQDAGLRPADRGREIVAAFRTIRDQLVFTNKRIISIDVQGLTGLKKSFAIMPHSKVQFFTIRDPGFCRAGVGFRAVSDVLQRLHREIRVPRQRRHRRPRPHHLHLRPVSPAKQVPAGAASRGLSFCVKIRKAADQRSTAFLVRRKGTRTPDLLVRSQSLYPTELPAHTTLSQRPIILAQSVRKCKPFFFVFPREILLQLLHVETPQASSCMRGPRTRTTPSSSARPICAPQAASCSGKVSSISWRRRQRSACVMPPSSQVSATARCRRGRAQRLSVADGADDIGLLRLQRRPPRDTRPCVPIAPRERGAVRIAVGIGRGGPVSRSRNSVPWAPPCTRISFQ